MSCPQTPDLVAGHFDRHLTPRARQALQQHLAECPECRAEVALLTPARDMLQSWQQEPVPEWSRGHGPVTHHHRQPLHKRRTRRSWGNVGRWIPLAASLVLSLAVLTQTRLDVSAQGWQLSFGSSAAERQLQQLDVYLAEQARVHQQQNQQMLDAALQHFSGSTTHSLVQVVDWFEQQRELDIRRMEAGFQQLLDRDYQTVNSVQQLASFVQYQQDLP